MYIDLGIVVALLIAVIVFFKKFSSVVYAFSIIDISLRILTFIKNNTVVELHNLIDKYFPESIPSMIDRYTDGTFYTLLMWIYVIMFCIFLGYNISYFIKKRR